MKYKGWLLLLIMSACTNDASQIGSNFFETPVLDVSVVDSVTVSLSTIKVESIITGSAGRILVGHHNDEQLGSITATPFFQLDVSDVSDIDGATTTFDHAAFVLFYDDYSFYDTLQPSSITVYKVTSTIEGDDSGILYAADTVSIDDVGLGSYSFLPHPLRDDSVEIALPADFGLDLYTKIINDDSRVSNNTEFRKYLKGLTLVPDDQQSGSILGFTLKSALRIYYRDKSVTPVVERFVSLPITSTTVSSDPSLYCTNIAGERAEVFDVLNSTRGRLSSDSTNGSAFIQGGTGLVTRIDFPYLNTLKAAENFYIVRAVLDIYPTGKSYSTNTSLPPELYVYKIDKKNVYYEQHTSNAVLLEDASLGRDTHYTLDVTTFVKEQLALEELNENGLMLLLDPTDLQSTVDRVYLSQPSRDYATKLNIYYATINNN